MKSFCSADYHGYGGVNQDYFAKLSNQCEARSGPRDLFSTANTRGSENLNIGATGGFIARQWGTAMTEWCLMISFRISAWIVTRGVLNVEWSHSSGLMLGFRTLELREKGGYVAYTLVHWITELQLSNHICFSDMILGLHHRLEGQVLLSLTEQASNQRDNTIKDQEGYKPKPEWRHTVQPTTQHSGSLAGSTQPRYDWIWRFLHPQIGS